jgi:hypothetical protein
METRSGRESKPLTQMAILKAEFLAAKGLWVWGRFP